MLRKNPRARQVHWECAGFVALHRATSVSLIGEGLRRLRGEDICLRASGESMVLAQRTGRPSKGTDRCGRGRGSRGSVAGEEAKQAGAGGSSSQDLGPLEGPCLHLLVPGFSSLPSPRGHPYAPSAQPCFSAPSTPSWPPGADRRHWLPLGHVTLCL